MYHRGIWCFRHAFIFLIITKVSEKVLSKEVQKRFHHVSFSPKEHHETAMNTATSWDSYEHIMRWTQQHHETAMNTATSQESYGHSNIIRWLSTQQHHKTAMNIAISCDSYEHSNVMRQKLM